MRLALFVTVCAASLAACDSTAVIPVTVQWMEWPAEVTAGQPFRTRLVVWGVCAVNPRFRPGVTADQSAVTFSPYFLAETNDEIFCLGGGLTMPLVVIAIDTAGMAPSLAASFSRTYEMRGAAWISTGGIALQEGLPVRTFGEVTVRPGSVDLSRRNAAGVVSKEVDAAGCVRIRPFGTYQPDAALPLDNQADTAGLSYTFVRGYIYAPAAPVCGETRVFHLVARN